MLKQNDSCKHCQKNCLHKCALWPFWHLDCLWDFLSQKISWNNRGDLTANFYQEVQIIPSPLCSTFLHSSDPLMIQFCSVPAPVQLTKQAEKYSPFLLGYCSIILVHWFHSPRVRWMPNLSQGSDRCAWPEKETDFWKQRIVFVVLWRLTPKLWETWNISSICMINLPEHQRCTQLSLGGTFFWRKSVTIF